MTGAPRFVPLWCRCSCGHQWDDWQPTDCPIETWIAHMKTVHCPVCVTGRVFMRNEPLAEKADDAP